MAMEPISGGYDTFLPPEVTVSVEDPASSSTTAKYTTSHSSTKHKTSTDTSTKQKTSTATGHKSSTSTCTSTSPTATNTHGFTYLQLHGKVPTQFNEEHFLSANFSQICPSRNCFTDCNNLTQVFNASPEALGNNTDIDVSRLPVTLFGVCSNLANATASVQDSDDAGLKSYFQSPSANPDNDIGLVTSNLTMCLVDTCDNTRNPSECNYCRPDYLLQSQNTLSIYPGVSNCTYQLCQSTCGLPYADQDVFGIGVSLRLPPPFCLCQGLTPVRSSYHTTYKLCCYCSWRRLVSAPPRCRHGSSVEGRLCQNR